MIRTLICAVSALACLPTAFASTCEDQKLVDLPDDGGTPVAWITPDFEIQALGPSSRRYLIHGVKPCMNCGSSSTVPALRVFNSMVCAPAPLPSPFARMF